VYVFFKRQQELLSASIFACHQSVSLLVEVLIVTTESRK